MAFLLRWVYTVGLTVSIPAILLRLWWKGRTNPGYRYHWKERLGIFVPPLQKGGLWIHAVSVGESVAAIPIIQALLERFPHLPITITSTTPTGYARIENSFKNKEAKEKIFHVYFPYDLPLYIKRFLNRVEPRLLVLMETELWPNCLWICKQRKIPILVVNGRLSAHSMAGYQRFKPVVKQMLDCVSLVVAQSEEDGARFVKLGLNKKRLVVTGNIKFDVPVQEGAFVEAIQLRVAWGVLRPVWIAASTHAGEEELILAAFDELRRIFNDLLLILVPRHPERFKPVANLLEQRGYRVVQRSSGNPVASDTQIYLGDTMGELGLLYAASDVAFVGGSLVPVGGHNTLEPAALGIPVIVGPHINNFIEITKLLTEAKALVKVSDTQSLTEAVSHWFTDRDARKLAGENGKAVVEKNRGAVDKVMELIQKQLKNNVTKTDIKGVSSAIVT